MSTWWPEHETRAERESGWSEDYAEEKAIAEYKKLKRKSWDRKVPLYSDYLETFFHTVEKIKEYCERTGIPIEDLRLLLCEPIYAKEVKEDYWSDDIVDGGKIPDKLVSAIEKLNKFIRKEKIILSYLPSKYALELNFIEELDADDDKKHEEVTNAKRSL